MCKPFFLLSHSHTILFHAYSSCIYIPTSHSCIKNKRKKRIKRKE